MKTRRSLLTLSAAVVAGALIGAGGGVGTYAALSGNHKTVIRQGAAACDVEAALFFADARKLDAALAALDLPPCDDGVLILKRSLPREKPPKISVNGGLATLTALQSLGEQWIDFHGPGEPRRLLKEGCQRELLDLFAENETVLEKYQIDTVLWVKAHEQLRRFLVDKKGWKEEYAGAYDSIYVKPR